MLNITTNSVKIVRFALCLEQQIEFNKLDS